MSIVKKYVFIGIVLLVIALLLAFVIANALDKKQDGLSDEQIRQKFECNRSTEEYRETDVYCENPDLYRQSLELQS